jgi:hypothetical protein
VVTDVLYPSAYDVAVGIPICPIDVYCAPIDTSLAALSVARIERKTHGGAALRYRYGVRLHLSGHRRPDGVAAGRMGLKAATFVLQSLSFGILPGTIPHRSAAARRWGLQYVRSRRVDRHAVHCHCVVRCGRDRWRDRGDIVDFGFAGGGDPGLRARTPATQPGNGSGHPRCGDKRRCGVAVNGNGVIVTAEAHAPPGTSAGRVERCETRRPDRGLSRGPVLRPGVKHIRRGSRRQDCHRRPARPGRPALP